MKANILNNNEIAKTPYSKVIISKKSTLHSHTFFEFSICINGSYNNIINGVNYEIKKGNIILLRPQDEHIIIAEKPHIARDVYVFPDTFKTICNTISPDLFDKIESQELLFNFDISNFDLQSLENELSYFNATDNKSKLALDIRHRSAILHIMDLWQQSLNHPTKNYPEWLILLIKIINTDKFFNKSISEIISTTNYSHGYVCREFKKHMGITLQEYVLEAKFSYAKAMLSDPNVTIKQIAYQLNYFDTTNFIIAFKNRYGITPSQYKKSMANNS